MIKADTNTMRLIQFLFIALVWQISSAHAQQSADYQILETVDHNSAYFTQGLELNNRVMFESSGLYLTLFADELFVLTWKENTLLVFDPQDLHLKRELKYEGEGWGLASNASQLIMSNGSDTITFRNPETFKVEREIQVRSQQHSVRRINELEFAQGFIWANVWGSPVIIKINPSTGNVESFFDFSELVLLHSEGTDNRVLNGIAYDPLKKAYWITGKLWPKRYLVSFD